MFLRYHNECFTLKAPDEFQLLEKLKRESIKGEGKYIYGVLETWIERTKTDFSGQDVQYGIYCNATVVLKIGALHKQSKNFYMLKSSNALMQKAINITCSVIQMMVDVFSCRTRHK